MLQPAAFIDLLAGLIETLPLHKTLSERGLVFAWSTFPEKAKSQLSPFHLAYAATQRILDPNPNTKLAIHVQLLTYLYPLENALPVIGRGLRADLQLRMQNPDRFHSIATVDRENQQAYQPPALPPAVPPAPIETLEQRRSRLERIAAQTGVKPFPLQRQ